MWVQRVHSKEDDCCVPFLAGQTIPGAWQPAREHAEVNAEDARDTC